MAARAAAAGDDKGAAAAGELQAAQAGWAAQEAALQQAVRVLRRDVAARQRKVEALVAEGDAAAVREAARASAAAEAELAALRSSLADNKVSGSGAVEEVG